MLSEKEVIKGIENFDKKYDEIALYFVKDQGDKIYIGEHSKCCRFCIRENLKFENESHAISRFFGNDQLILLNECDDCNAEFGKKLEPHIDAFTKPFRTASFISGRNGIVKTQDKKQKSSLYIKDGIQKVLNSPDSDFCKLDTATNEITYNFDIAGHIPSAVYKSLIKYGLSCLPSEYLKDHIQLLYWISQKDVYQPFYHPLIAVKTFIAGQTPLNGRVVAGLYNKKKGVDEKCINRYFLFGFGNFLYQIPLFTDTEIKKINDSTQNGSGQESLTISRFFPPYSLKKLYGLADFTQYSIEDFSSCLFINDKKEKLVCSGEIKQISLDDLEEIHNKSGRLIDVKLKIPAQ